MTRVFLYEFVTGGGWWSVEPAAPPSGSLLNEAAAMIRALADDFSRVPGIEASCLWDVRLPDDLRPTANVSPVSGAEEEHQRFLALATTADYVLLLAPEFDGHLLHRVAMVERLRCRLLSPHRDFVAIASDKHATAEWLSRAGVSVPLGVLYSTGMSIPTWLQWPAVLKPCDGAGSLDIRLVHSAEELATLPARRNLMRLEQYCRGIPASIAVLCQGKKHHLFPAGRQMLSGPETFQYLGGDFPLNAALGQRAAQLALAAMNALPETSGYVGIDLVLGDKSDGSGDFVIEVNPRLTTSYIALRQLCHQNLAAVMLAIARGETVELSFDQRSICFEVI